MPGSNQYFNYDKDAYASPQRVKIKGTYNPSEVAVGCIDAIVNTVAANPSAAAYKEVDLDKIRKKPRYTVIEEKLKRWSPGEDDKKHASPSSVSYEVASAVDKAVLPKKTEYRFSTQKRVSMFAAIGSNPREKRPGVGQYNADVRATQKTCQSPLLKKARH